MASKPLALEVEPHERLKIVPCDHLGIGGIEPVVRVAAAMRVAVARSDAAAAYVEERDIGRGVDVAGAAALDGGVARLLEELVEPEVVVEAHAQHRLRLAHAREILRARLEALGVPAGGDQVRDGDGVATDGGCKRMQLGRGGDEVKLGEGRSSEQRPGNKGYFRQSDLGITQWMFFSEPDSRRRGIPSPRLSRP